MGFGNARQRATKAQRHTAFAAVILIGLALSVAACSTAHTPPAPEWIKTRESPEDLERARETCKQQALADVSAEYHDPMTAKAGAGTFFKCMASKGWKQASKAETTPASP